MQLLALVFTGILASSPAASQRAGSSLSPSASSSAADTSTEALPDFPVSLEKIRDALGRRVSVSILRRLADTPTFRLEIEERRRIDELLATLDFKSGPTPPGGVYGFEQQRLAFPPVSRPLAQPYAAFNSGQLLTVAAENLAGKALAGRVGESATKALRQRAQENARKVVDAAVADYCRTKPDGGAGIALCDQQPVDR